MARSQELRRVENKKRTLGLQLKHGIPNVNDLREGENEFRSTSEGVVEYIKLNNVLYKQVLDPVNVSSTVSEPAISQASDYDSGWFSVAVNSTYDKTFGWVITTETIPSIVKILWSDDATPIIGTDEIWEVQSGQYYFSGAGANCYIEYYSSTVIRLHTGRHKTFYAASAHVGGTGIDSTGGYYKLQVWK